MTPSETFAKRMCEARRARAWTQQQLSAELASLYTPIGRSALAKIETGSRDIALDEAIAIAAALSVPLDVLLDERPLLDRLVA